MTDAESRCHCGKYELTRPSMRFDNGERHYLVQCISVQRSAPETPVHIGDTIGDTRIPDWTGVVVGITYYKGHSELETIHNPAKQDPARPVAYYDLDPLARGLLSTWPSTTVLIACPHATIPAPEHHEVAVGEQMDLFGSVA